MADPVLEREEKFDVDDAFRLPPLRQFVPPGGSVDIVALDIESTYFDTAHRDLQRSRVTLRRRETAAEDAGWQLKVPDPQGRLELRLPPTEAPGLPAELDSLTRGLRRGRPVQRVAALHTIRTAHRLLGPDGEVVAEIADDRVSAHTFGADSAVTTWREVEVELGQGNPALLRKIGKQLRRSGARRSSSASKLARAIGPVPVGDATAKAGTLGELIRGFLVEQREELQRGDVELRRGTGDVHDVRVAIRRIRSALRIYAPVVDTDAAAALDGELRWYSAVLGDVRDLDVLGERLDSAVKALPESVVFGPVSARIAEHIARARAEDVAELNAALDSDRYVALLADLDRWCSAPPLTAAAERPARRAQRYLDTAHRRLDRKLAAVGSGKAGAEDVHKARKAAKRLRYAAELAGPAVGKKPTVKLIKRLKGVQASLGTFQDSVVAADLLLRLGRAAGADGTPEGARDGGGTNGFTYGVLYALEQQEAARARRHVHAL